MSHLERAGGIAIALVTACAVAHPPVHAQTVQAPAPASAPVTTRPQAQAPAPATTRPAQVGGGSSSAPASFSRRSATPQGFSVVLVLGDLQGASATDDVPVAARKALTDMREFLPFKSYRLLDAAWLMCCGEQRAKAVSERRPPSENVVQNVASQMLRGPEDQEYELRLSTSRTDNARVFVRFTLVGSTAPAEATSAAATTAAMRTTERRIADLRDKAGLLQKQITEARGRVEVGTDAGREIPKMEVELRSTQREIEDLSTRLASGVAYGVRSGQRSSVSERSNRGAVIDTSFSMDVGETVVVGTSRLKGGTRALIALLTAVPSRATKN